MHLIKGNKYLIPKHRMTWRNRCWQSHKSDVSCSWSAGLHTSQEWFWSTPLYRSSPNHEGFEAVTWQLEAPAPSTHFYRIKVWRLARTLHDLNVLLLEPLLCCIDCMFWVLVMLETHPRPIFSALAEGRRFLSKMLRSIGPTMWWSCPVTLAEKQPQSIRFPPLCLTEGMVFLGLYSAFISLQTRRANWFHRVQLWSHVSSSPSPKSFLNHLGVHWLTSDRPVLYMCLLEQGDLVGTAGFQAITL